VVQRVWVQLDDPLKNPLAYAYEDDDFVYDLVVRVLKREEGSVRSSDVKAYVKRGADDEVKFTEKVSQILERDIGTAENPLLLLLQKGISFILCLIEGRPLAVLPARHSASSAPL
jgi:hypothetical protein